MEGFFEKTAKLCPFARFPYDILYYYQPVIDFRHLEFEQRGNKLRIRPRHHYSGTFRGDPDVFYISPDHVASLQVLIRKGLLYRQQGIRLPEVEIIYAFFFSHDHSADDLSDLVFEFIVDCIPLRFPYSLENDLLCGLGSYPAEIVQVQRDIRSTSLQQHREKSFWHHRQRFLHLY